MFTLLTSRIQASHSSPVIPTGIPTSLLMFDPMVGVPDPVVHIAHSQEDLHLCSLPVPLSPLRGPGPHPLFCPHPT